MINRPKSEKPAENKIPQDFKGEDIFDNQILALIFDIVFLVYSIIYTKITEFSGIYLPQNAKNMLRHPMA